MARERRQHIRLNAERGLIHFDSVDGRVSGSGELSDISEGGLRFHTDEETDPPAVDEQIIVMVTLGPPLPPLRLTGVVRLAKEAHSPPGHNIAIEFVELNDRQKKFLEQAVMQVAMRKIRGEHFDRSEETASEGPKRLGEILVEQGHVSHDDLRRFMVEEFKSDERLGEQMVSKGLVRSDQVASALSSQTGLPVADLSQCAPRLPVIRRLKRKDMTDLMIVPFLGDGPPGDVINMACAFPLPPEEASRIRRQVEGRIEYYLADREQIFRLIEMAFTDEGADIGSGLRAPRQLVIQYKFYNTQWEPIVPDTFVGAMENLSAAGCHFTGPRPRSLSEGQILSGSTRLGLCMLDEGGAPRVRVPAKPIRVTAVPRERNICLYAVTFLDLSENDRSTLMKISNAFTLSVHTQRKDEYKELLDY